MTLARLLPRFRRAYRALESLERRERWTRVEIEAHQLERVNTLWASATAEVPYYRNLARTHRTPTRFSSLEEFRARVPLLPRELVKQQPELFLSTAVRPGTWRLTGGSTGEPTRIYWGHDAHRTMLRAKYRFYQAWGIDIFDRMAYLWGRGAPGRRQLLEDRLRNRLRLSAYFLDPPQLDRYLERIERFRPASIYSYATAAYVLARAAERRGFSCDALRLVTMTSEPAFPAIVRAVERAFNVPAVVEYGSVDCGFTAAEYPDRTVRVREDLSIVETQPRKDGRYDIVVTVLNNPSFPLVRYAIGDVTDAPLTRPAAGFCHLANVAGRVNDLARAKGGQLVHFSWFDKFFQATQAFRRWQIHQAIDGAVSVSLELERSDASPDLRALERKLSQQLGGYPVEMRVVDDMPKTVAGKHRWVISELFDQRLAS